MGRSPSFLWAEWSSSRWAEIIVHTHDSNGGGTRVIFVFDGGRSVCLGWFDRVSISRSLVRRLSVDARRRVREREFDMWCPQHSS